MTLRSLLAFILCLSGFGLSVALPVAAQPGWPTAADVSSFTSGESDSLMGVDSSPDFRNPFRREQPKLQLSDEFLRFNTVTRFPAKEPEVVVVDEFPKPLWPEFFLIFGMFLAYRMKRLFRALTDSIWGKVATHFGV